MNRRKGCLSVLRIEVIVPVLFVLTFITAFLIMIGESPAPTSISTENSKPQESTALQDTPQETNPPQSSHEDGDSKDSSGETYVKYTTLTGYFLQDDVNTDANAFQYNTSNFGLIDRSYDTDSQFDPDRKETQWKRFEYHLSTLNNNSKNGETTKIFFLGRHGQGGHNVAEARYGTEAWDCYYSMLDGKDGIIWADAHLTPVGNRQAVLASSTFHTAFTVGGLPTPQSYYVSPLWRCLETAEITFHAIAEDLPASRPFNPVIKELFRETIGVHTCDRRSRRSELIPLWQNMRGFEFEKGFTEEDELWKPNERETDAATDDRAEQALEDLWKDDKNEWISVTAHSGMIASLLRVIGHRKFALETGGVIPVLVKAQKTPGKRPVRDGVKWTTVSTCPKPTVLTKAS